MTGAVCRASGALWGEWPARSGRWNDRGDGFIKFWQTTHKKQISMV